MASKSQKRGIVWGGGLMLVLLLLCGPVADGLRAPELTLRPGETVDAVYLVCGARAQPRRLQALRDALDARPELRTARLWVGNDAQKSFWSRLEQRNLNRAEWAVKHLRQMQETDADAPPAIMIVPGTFSGTDGEMEALAAFLADQPEVASIALVTSPYHARRTVTRLRAHAPPDLTIRVVPVTPVWSDRQPLIVLGERIKMLRDAAGLSRTPGLSRRMKTPPATHGVEPAGD